MSLRRKRFLVVIGLAIGIVALARWWHYSPMRVRWLVSMQLHPRMSHSLYFSDMLVPSNECVQGQLKDLGPHAVPTLLGLLGDPKERVQQISADDLGLLRDRRAVKPLCDV